MTELISKTKSLCPICLQAIEAKIISQGSNAYMEKACPEHGVFKTLLWKGSIPIQKWVRKKERAYIKNPNTEVVRGCPYDCGLCSEHRQHTCTALIEVTQNCNLNCSFCFADSGCGSEKGPSIEEIELQYKSILKTSGICNIQLSGGEPTLRDDLPLIIKIGYDLGFKFIQVNTNGIRIAEDENYVKLVKEAGLASIFLQFDGTEDSIYKALRGKKLLDIKIKAIENCKKYKIGVVLVPTLVPKINLGNIGEIINFALKFIPTVRGVHFQPVSYFGRVPHNPRDEDRITLPEIMDEIERQTEGKINVESLKPPGCENALCSFHGSYIYTGNGELMNITKNKNCCSSEEEKHAKVPKVKVRVKKNIELIGETIGSDCCCKTEKAEEGALKAKEYVSRNWSLKKHEVNDGQLLGSKSKDWDAILDNIYNNSFSISAMAFQDAWNVDLERVKDCCIHVVNPDGKLIPFCIYNISGTEGRTLYRTKQLRS